MLFVKSSSLATISLLLISIASATAQEVFRPGTYYDQKDRSVSGFIAIPPSAGWTVGPLAPRDASNSYILYKSDSLGDTNKIPGHKLKSFTIARDSFAVLRHFKIFGDKYLEEVPIGFCRVIVGDGKVILYTNTSSDYLYTDGGILVGGTSMGTPSTSTTLLVQQRGGTHIMAVEMGIEEFVTQMSQYFKINDEIVAKIKNREYSYFKTEQLVRDFNAWFRARKQSSEISGAEK